MLCRYRDWKIDNKEHNYKLYFFLVKFSITFLIPTNVCVAGIVKYEKVVEILIMEF